MLIHLHKGHGWNYFLDFLEHRWGLSAVCEIKAGIEQSECWRSEVRDNSNPNPRKSAGFVFIERQSLGRPGTKTWSLCWHAAKANHIFTKTSILFFLFFKCSVRLERGSGSPPSVRWCRPQRVIDSSCDWGSRAGHLLHQRSIIGAEPHPILNGQGNVPNPWCISQIVSVHVCVRVS